MPNAHSPEFITEMKQKLESEKKTLERELQQIGTTHTADEGTEAKFEQYGRDDEENATEVADFVARTSTTDTLEVRLKNVGDALERIELGTYGQTEDGQVIPEERLRANPAATTLVTPSES